ncbi:MAG: nicotinate-nucleotide--dimethylbenzimidazole phosphoribosyltransferase [Candidatus Magnetominusculus sp. LBB02]|nr:nicotinate-nucleotide--dimethylbenzimidazole phosphoribosyltransferase [Candidatus Magnetominusculus sp. LBB02]
METIKSTCGKIMPLKKEFFYKAQGRLDILTKPQGSLGQLEQFAARLVAIYEDAMPELPKKAVFVFAGDHGVAEEGVSAFPAEVTPQMVLNFLRGGAAINVLSRHAGADVLVVDAGVNYDFKDCPGLIQKKVVYGTKNIAKGPAMSRDEAVKCINVGIALAYEYAAKGIRMFATGEMGIANTTPSSAIAAVFSGKPAKDVTGRGTGIGDEGLQKKIEVIERAIAVNAPDAKDPIDVLAKLGGAEIGAIAGLCLGAASLRLPVVIDGFISTAGAVIAYGLNETVKEYMFSAHRSFEIGHRAMLAHMGFTPMLELDMRLGEGTGAAIAMTILDASLKIYREMATFQDAGVSDKS